jgi:hypothetical protein
VRIFLEEIKSSSNLNALENENWDSFSESEELSDVQRSTGLITLSQPTYSAIYKHRCQNWRLIFRIYASSSVLLEIWLSYILDISAKEHGCTIYNTLIYRRRYFVCEVCVCRILTGWTNYSVVAASTNRAALVPN